MRKRSVLMTACVLVAALLLTGCPRYGDPALNDSDGDATAAESNFLSDAWRELGISIGMRFTPVFGPQESSEPPVREL
jgi:hypothetical protein